MALRVRKSKDLACHHCKRLHTWLERRVVLGSQVTRSFAASHRRGGMTDV